MREGQDLRTRARRVRLAALRGAAVGSDLLDHSGAPYPVTSQQLKDLAWDARFVEITCHLAERGLGELEETDPTVIARSVEHALYLFDRSVVETEASAGKGLIRWEWPEPEFINALEVVVEVSEEPRAGQRTPATIGKTSKKVLRRPGESGGQLPFTVNTHSNSRVRISVAMAVCSPTTGEVYQSVHRDRVTVLVPGLPRPEQTHDPKDPVAQLPQDDLPPLVLGEPDEDLTKQEPFVEWARRHLTRRTVFVFFVAVAIVVASAVAAFQPAPPDAAEQPSPVLESRQEVENRCRAFESPTC